MDILSVDTRRLAIEMIIECDKWHGLNIKGGLIGMGLDTRGKAYKMMGSQAREKFVGIWHRTSWGNRESILVVLPFLLRAYQLMPRCGLHEALDRELLKDGLRIRDGELRRMVKTVGRFHDAIA